MSLCNDVWWKALAANHNNLLYCFSTHFMYLMAVHHKDFQKPFEVILRTAEPQNATKKKNWKLTRDIGIWDIFFSFCVWGRLCYSGNVAGASSPDVSDVSRLRGLNRLQDVNGLLLFLISTTQFFPLIWPRTSLGFIANFQVHLPLASNSSFLCITISLSSAPGGKPRSFNLLPVRRIEREQVY